MAMIYYDYSILSTPYPDIDWRMSNDVINQGCTILFCKLANFRLFEYSVACLVGLANFFCVSHFVFMLYQFSKQYLVAELIPSDGEDLFFGSGYFLLMAVYL